jgi:hypothetical protein
MVKKFKFDIYILFIILHGGIIIVTLQIFFYAINMKTTFLL